MPGARPAVSTALARRDLRLLLVSLALVLAWEWSGLDRPASALFGSAQGFAWRDSAWASGLLHDGGRLLAGLVLALLVLDTVRPWLSGPSRAERAWTLAVVLLSIIAVPALKRLSGTSCPWDWAVFGGTAERLPHWQFWRSDGGPGHCFPSGHAVSAFGFIGLFHLWRGHRPVLARALLGAVLSFGLLFGGAQLVRGAHAVSHTLWSAWLCLLLASAGDALRRAVFRAPRAHEKGRAEARPVSPEAAPARDDQATSTIRPGP